MSDTETPRDIIDIQKWSNVDTKIQTMIDAVAWNATEVARLEDARDKLNTAINRIKATVQKEANNNLEEDMKAILTEHLADLKTIQQTLRIFDLQTDAVTLVRNDDGDTYKWESWTVTFWKGLSNPEKFNSASFTSNGNTEKIGWVSAEKTTINPKNPKEKPITLDDGDIKLSLAEVHKDVVPINGNINFKANKSLIDPRNLDHLEAVNSISNGVANVLPGSEVILEAGVDWWDSNPLDTAVATALLNSMIADNNLAIRNLQSLPSRTPEQDAEIAIRIDNVNTLKGIRSTTMVDANGRINTDVNHQLLLTNRLITYADIILSTNPLVKLKILPGKVWDKNNKKDTDRFVKVTTEAQSDLTPIAPGTDISVNTKEFTKKRLEKIMYPKRNDITPFTADVSADQVERSVIAWLLKVSKKPGMSNLDQLLVHNMRNPANPVKMLVANPTNKDGSLRTPENITSLYTNLAKKFDMSIDDVKTIVEVIPSTEHPAMLGAEKNSFAIDLYQIAYGQPWAKTEGAETIYTNLETAKTIKLTKTTINGKSTVTGEPVK